MYFITYSDQLNLFLKFSSIFVYNFFILSSLTKRYLTKFVDNFI